MVRTHWAVIGFSIKVNFDDVLSVLTTKLDSYEKFSLRSDCPTLLVKYIVNFSLVKQEQRSQGKKQ